MNWRNRAYVAASLLVSYFYSEWTHVSFSDGGIVHLRTWQYECDCVMGMMMSTVPFGSPPKWYLPIARREVRGKPMSDTIPITVVSHAWRMGTHANRDWVSERRLEMPPINEWANQKCQDVSWPNDVWVWNTFSTYCTWQDRQWGVGKILPSCQQQQGTSHVLLVVPERVEVTSDRSPTHKFFRPFLGSHATFFSNHHNTFSYYRTFTICVNENHECNNNN